MGITFSAAALPSRSGGTPVNADRLFDSIAKAIEKDCNDPFLAELIKFERFENAMLVTLHPAAEPVIFHQDEGGAVLAQGKTSTLGPGFHAYAVSVLKAVGRICRLEWQWDDESGYADDEDFAALQGQMAQYFAALAGQLSRLPEDVSGVAVDMPMGFPPPVDLDAFSLTLLGPRSREYWRSVANSKDPAAAAAENYVWWKKDRDADFYDRSARALMWSLVRWRPPADEDEHAFLSLTFDFVARAARSDPARQLPKREAVEIKKLQEVGPEDRTPVPPPDAIGYYRHRMRLPLPGGWRITLPGYWMETMDEDTHRYCYFHDGNTVGVQTSRVFSVNATKDDRDALLALPDDVPEGARIIEFKKEDCVGRAFFAPVESEDGKKLMMLAGKIVAGINLADVLAYFTQDRADEAESIFSSLIPPPPEDDEEEGTDEDEDR